MGTVRIKDHWAEQRLFEQRVLAAAFVIAALTLVLIGRLVVLQVMRYDYYAELSQGNRVRVEPLPAQRGLILDRKGLVLAENRPAFQLELVRERVPDVEATLNRLIEIGVLPDDDLDDTRKLVRSRRSFESVPIRLRLTDEEIARFAVHRFEFPGVDIATRLTRFYPHGEHAVHALGYVAAISENDVKRLEKEKELTKYAGTSLIGKLGIEYSFEKTLHGTDGSRQILVNAAGRSVQRQGTLTPDLPVIDPVAGRDVLTSIDLPTQLVAEQGLIGRRGAVVAIDPNNGDVIALVSTPGFDPNAFGRGLTRAEYAALRDNIDIPLLNRAIRGEYPPGSTVKPVIALAGLANGVTTPQRSKVCYGSFSLPGSSHRYRDWRPGGHGTVSMETAIAQSCDVYFYDLANMLGVDKLSEFLAHFGFGANTGIDISGERKGVLPSREWKRGYFKAPEQKVWFPGETVIFGIGQGFLTVTPMQLAHMTSIVASRGKSYQPRLVTAYREQSTGKTEPIAPKLLETVDVASAENWQVAVDGMVKAMKAPGTGWRSQVGAEYQIAGKTGTAQVFTVKQNESYKAMESRLNERLLDHGWFIAFAPADAPKLAVAVLIENGKHGTAAAAIARRVLDQFLLGKTTTPEIPPPVVLPTGAVVVAPDVPGDE
ncbi:MAG TPA: penicillin-binding protein 2 [Steroidobacteraceae bacterium]|nr:penicillin-binding protein 2 [Steroidobacteraceae bacterium]